MLGRHHFRLTVVRMFLSGRPWRSARHSWSTRLGSRCRLRPRPPVGFRQKTPKVKDVVRQLLLERINGLLVAGYHEPDHCLIIWDISDQQELEDFSASISEFRNAYDGTPRSERLAPAALGGLSHDWSRLQSADVIAHFALHYMGNKASLDGAKAEKARAFKQEFLPRLQRTSTGHLVGWKEWSKT